MFPNLVTVVLKTFATSVFNCHHSHSSLSSTSVGWPSAEPGGGKGVARIASNAVYHFETLCNVKFSHLTLCCPSPVACTLEHVLTALSCVKFAIWFKVTEYTTCTIFIIKLATTIVLCLVDDSSSTVMSNVFTKYKQQEETRLTLVFVFEAWLTS